MLAEVQTASDAPWKQRYRTQGVVWTLIAKGAPTRGLACSKKTGVFQLYAWDVPSGELRQLTNVPTGKADGVISPDGRYVYYLDDKGGNEVGHYVRVPFDGGEVEEITPDLPPYASWNLEISRDGNTIGFMAANEDGFQAFAVNVGPDGTLGTPRCTFQGKRFAVGPFLSQDGNIAVLTTTERGDMLNYNLLALDTATGEAIGELWDGTGSSVEATAFSPIPGDTRLLGRTNRTGVRRPIFWDPRTGQRTDLEIGDLEGEVLPLDWSDDGQRVLLCQFSRAVQRLFVYHVENATLQPLDHPGGTYGVWEGLNVYFAPDNEIFAQWQDASQPSQVIALDATSGAVKRKLLAGAQVPIGRPWKSVSFQSSDGEEIQGWLGLPDGEGPFPTILHTHGGPEAVTTELFAPGLQSWMDHGFAFLTINYRGSTTFGREFQQKIWGNPGQWEVEDMVAARDWLVKEGISHPDQIIVTGGSYGGYLTLLPLGMRPDLWAGGMGVVAIADWRMMYEDSAETLRGYQRAIFGGTPEEMPEQYATSSPITYVEHVRALLLVIQGRNDTRCPDRQMEAYIDRLKEQGKPIEVYWFEAGHGSLEVEEQIKQQEMMLQFAHKIVS
jgi:dipeptidyl aminopeptidase/acylaminoacyl peptidase